MNCGIIGLPNVGKSTIFSALTATPAKAENYPFCTINPNIGIVEVSDPRLDHIHEIVEAENRIPATIEFVDIAGLVKGASKGEGLGNQFLSSIRTVGIIAHVVRCFEDNDVIHVNAEMDAATDIEIINTELALADLQSVEKRLEKNSRQLKSSISSIRKEAQAVQSLLSRAITHLDAGKPLRTMETDEEDLIRLNELFLITLKTQIYVCNVRENEISTETPHTAAVRRIAGKEGAEVIVLAGKLEADIATLDDPQERSLFIADSGISESGLSQLARSAYAAMGLETFFTVGGKENRAWTFSKGAGVAQCAGIIHSDFERGFIKAEVYNCNDLFELGSEAAVKSAGRLRIEGRDYLVQDGDVIHFKFNV